MIATIAGSRFVYRQIPVILYGVFDIAKTISISYRLIDISGVYRCEK